MANDSIDRMAEALAHDIAFGHAMNASNNITLGEAGVLKALIFTDIRERLYLAFRYGQQLARNDSCAKQQIVDMSIQWIHAELKKAGIDITQGHEELRRRLKEIRDRESQYER